MKKDLHLLFWFFLISFGIISCGPGQVSGVTPTDIYTPLTKLTSTPEYTPTPTFSLNCTIIETDLEASVRPSNVFALTGQFSGIVESYVIDGLRLEIIGEAGAPEISGELSADIDNAGNIKVTINQVWGYESTNNTYAINGSVIYGIGNPKTMTRYEIEVSGGGFNQGSQTCSIE